MIQLNYNNGAQVIVDPLADKPIMECAPYSQAQEGKDSTEGNNSNFKFNKKYLSLEEAISG